MCHFLCYTIPMEIYSIGNVIREYRQRLNISQEELAFDLCAVSTLSRIESGAQVPGRKLAEALFSRMGMLMPAGNLPMSKADYIRSILEYEINGRVATSNYDIDDLLETYKTCGDKLDVLEEQFYLFYKTMADDSKEHNAVLALKNFEKALQMSVKDYETGKIPTARYLTKTELMLLNNIARMQYFLGQKTEAIELMEFLRGYFENGIISEEEKAKNYPVILHNLENWYGLAGKGQKSLELCEKGIEVCIRYGKLTQFPYQLFNKGYALALLGRKEEAKKYIQDSFVIFDTMKEHDNVVYASKIMNKEFNFHFLEE